MMKNTIAKPLELFVYSGITLIVYRQCVIQCNDNTSCIDTKEHICVLEYTKT